jgi:tetratricopeptide (TPR) repeat protein
MTISHLGKLAIRGQVIEGLPKKGLDILEFLAVNRGERFRRDELARRFWPDVSREKGLNNLRQVLFQMQKALGAAFPLSCRHEEVYCRRSAVRNAKSETLTYPALLKTISIEGPSEDTHIELLTTFRQLPIMTQIADLDQESLRRAEVKVSKVDIDFFRSFSYLAVRQDDKALAIAHQMVREARSNLEISHAHHALGAIQAHLGNFAEGLKNIWISIEHSRDFKQVQAHATTNLAILAYEGYRNDDLLLGQTHAQQLIRESLAGTNELVLDYVEALSLIRDRRFPDALRVTRPYTGLRVEALNMMASYFLEAEAEALIGLGELDEAAERLKTADIYRKHFHLLRTKVEGQRVNRLRQTISQGQLTR